MNQPIKKIIGLSLCTVFLLHTNLLAENKNKNESLGKVDVIATDLNITEGTNSYTTPSMKTSTKLNLSIKETPQSISVFTTKKLKDLGISSYQNMLNYVTGVTLNRWDERLNSSARGFVIDYYKIDGMPTYTSYNARDIDLSMYDRVEVVRGANGLTTGAGNPGISINLVRKRANSEELTGTLSVEAGSWNSYNASADISSKITEDGSIRGRIVAKHEKADSYMDGYEKQNDLFYGVIDADLSDTTYLSTGISYHNLERKGVRWGGLPAFYSDGTQTDFGSDKIVSEDWTYWNVETKSFFTNLEQFIYKDISLNTSYSYDEIKSESALLYFAGAVNKTNGSGLNSMDWQDEKEKKEHNLDLNVNIPFDLGRLSQEVIIGATYNLSKQTKSIGRYPAGAYEAVSNFYNYDIKLPSSSSSDIPYIVEPEEIEQKALYLAGNFSLTDELKLIAGARLSTWKYTSENSSLDTREFDNELTPYLGLVYDLDKNHSIYTSYTSIFNPQDKKNKNGNYLDPIEGKSYEAGIKGEYFDGALNASLSIFKIEQDNVASAIDGVFVIGSSNQAYESSEGVVSKGFEIDIAGRITDNLNVDFGIANFRAKDADGEKYDTKASRTTANVFLSYLIDDFTLGGGLQYKSKYYTETNYGKINQKAYTIANAMLGYKIDKNSTLQLNVNNVFDKTYYQGVGTNSMVYGDPRNFTLNYKYSF